MIRLQVQESIHLDYKQSRALEIKKRDEIAKDVSAFANSDGGTLIYGIEEKDNVPVAVDGGVDDAVFSREWLDNIIRSNISPSLADVRISPIPLGNGRSLYVVAVAKSFRAPHQAPDKKFYKRFNFSSVPMEEYEINDVRNRRSYATPIITVSVGEYRRFIATFDIGSVGDAVAENVSFEFIPEIPWDERKGKPVLLANGIKKFPPGQQFRFLYHPFHQILGGAVAVPTDFVVRVSYYHPVVGRRVSDEWPVSFGAYMHSTAVRSEVDDHAKDIAAHLKEISQLLKGIRETIKYFDTLRGSTGLDLSIPTLRNLKRVLVQQDPERIDPKYADYKVFSEILGVDLEMASRIEGAMRISAVLTQVVREIPGMTDELLTKFASAFVIEDWPTSNPSSKTS